VGWPTASACRAEGETQDGLTVESARRWARPAV